MNRALNHPAFTSITMQQVESLDQRVRSCASVQTIVTMVDKMTPLAMQHTLRFLYTGTLDASSCPLQEVLIASKLLDIPALSAYIANILNHEDYLNCEVHLHHVSTLKDRLVDVCLLPGLLTDILFQVEDGNCAAHRPVLMARSEMMGAMFSGDFREGSAKVVEFPGVRRDIFCKLLMYLYTDSVPPIKSSECIELLGLANRLCLRRLVALVEQNVINQLCQIAKAGGDVSEEALHLLEPCQLHNAEQLAEWCMSHVATNYNTICKQSSKLLRNLHPENQAYLNQHRWPPVWYLKEFDYYERCVQEREREEKPLLKRHRNNSGCLCFSSKSRRNSDKRNYCTM
jgi:Rho-related BTB domain-containing protein 1/2